MRVVIAEDLALLREGISRLLNDHGFEVVAAVADGEAFLAAVDEHRPDVCVVDVRLPPGFKDEGVRAALEARRRIEGLPILVLSQYVERTYAAELLSDGRGGVGYLLKDRVAEVRDFVDAVRRVAEGGTALDPEAVSQLLGQRDDGRGGADPAGHGLDGLHKRLAALDGTLAIASPKGGPTVLYAEVPCAS